MAGDGAEQANEMPYLLTPGHSSPILWQSISVHKKQVVMSVGDGSALITTRVYSSQGKLHSGRFSSGGISGREEGRGTQDPSLCGEHVQAVHRLCM